MGFLAYKPTNLNCTCASNDVIILTLVVAFFCVLVLSYVHAA